MSTALYMRYSVMEDARHSIASQRKILAEYLDKQPDLKATAVKEYTDEGYPGNNFQRPAFTALLSDARHRVIDTVIVTDFTRLGTDFTEIKDYIEHIFPFLNVRFLALADHYDSRQYEMINASTATAGIRDTSIRVQPPAMYRKKQNFETDKKTAEADKSHIYHKPPFGYQLDLQTGGWCKDLQAAAWVCDIFALAGMGCSTSEISDYLNENHAPTPAKYQKANHASESRQRQIVPDTEALWDCAKVRTILRRQEYTGALVTGRRKTIHTGSRISRKMDETQVRIEKGHHPAIVTEAAFENAQSSVRKRKKDAYRIQRDFILKGKIRCGCCKSALGYLNSGNTPKLYCPHKKITGSYSNCPDTFYEEAELEKIVFEMLAEHLHLQTQDITAELFHEHVDCVYVYSLKKIDVLYK